MKVKFGPSFFALAVLLSGCGGGGGLSTRSTAYETCQKATACGGNIVGSWSIASTCVNDDLSKFTDGCPGAFAQTKDYQVTGMISYSSGSTFTLTSTRTGKVAVRYPAACLTPPDGVEVTCSQLGAGLAAGGKYDSVDCVSNGAGCDCTFGLTPEIVSGADMYSISADNVLSTADYDQSIYCVKGDGTATLSTLPTSPVLGHQGLTGAFLTLTKQ
jgi:hypothetical protein